MYTIGWGFHKESQYLSKYLVTTNTHFANYTDHHQAVNDLSSGIKKSCHVIQLSVKCVLVVTGNIDGYCECYTNGDFSIVWPCIVTDSLWIKPTDALNFNFIGITTLHVSGGLSAHHQEFLAVHRLWYILCNFDDRLLPGVGWHRDVRLRTPDDGQKDCPKHVES